MAGRVPVAILEPDELERRPPRRVAAPVRDRRPPTTTDGLELDPDEQASVVRRLRALGYVE
jgi:hypothetical protein